MVKKVIILVKVKIIQGHVLDALKKIPDNTIDCIITSPPYWGLRKYPDSANVQWSDGWYGQLGLEPTLELYIEHLLQITKELKRVLKPSGVMFWNHGDCYGGNMGFTISTRSDAPIKRKLPSKTMALQNFRLVLRMIDEQGWILRNVIIWHKPNHLPESVKDRFTRAYEPIFMFVKSKKYFFNLDAVREPLKSSTIQRIEQWIRNDEDNKDFSKLKPSAGNPNPVYVLQRLVHKFNYRVREAKKGYFEKIGVRASEEEMQKYDNQGRPIGKYGFDWDDIKSDSESELTIGGIGRFFVWQREKGRTSSILGKNPSDTWKFLDEKSLIWLAGILDSEGSIYATKHDRRDDTTRHYKNVSYEGYVEIVNTDSRLIEIASKIISEILNKEVAINIRDLENKGYRNVYRITLFGEDASKLCEILLPYLITKKERAKLLIELQKTKEIRKPFSETHEEIIKKREEDLNFCPDFWAINTEPFPDAHFATFPTELVRRCIKAGCPEDGVVLDPFVGSGTTIKVAIEERRNVIGIEIVPEYVEMAEKRCNLIGNPFIEYEKIVLGDNK
jgi:DNA modification methylase